MTKSTVPVGHRRFMWDAKTAWRKMTPKQRTVFMAWVLSAEGQALPILWDSQDRASACGIEEVSHRVAEALEERAPDGVVVGEDERATITEALSLFVTEGRAGLVRGGQSR